MKNLELSLSMRLLLLLYDYCEKSRFAPFNAIIIIIILLLSNRFSSGSPARCLLLHNQCLGWFAGCKYTVVGCDCKLISSLSNSVVVCKIVSANMYLENYICFAC